MGEVPLYCICRYPPEPQRRLALSAKMVSDPLTFSLSVRLVSDPPTYSWLHPTRAGASLPYVCYSQGESCVVLEQVKLETGFVSPSIFETTPHAGWNFSSSSLLLSSLELSDTNVYEP